MRQEHLRASAQMEKLRLGKVRVILSLPHPREPLAPVSVSGQVQRRDLRPVRGPLAPGCPGGVGRASWGLLSPSSAQFPGAEFPPWPSRQHLRGGPVLIQDDLDDLQAQGRPSLCHHLSLLRMRMDTQSPCLEAGLPVQTGGQASSPREGGQHGPGTRSPPRNGERSQAGAARAWLEGGRYQVQAGGRETGLGDLVTSSRTP